MVDQKFVMQPCFMLFSLYALYYAITHCCQFASNSCICTRYVYSWQIIQG